MTARQSDPPGTHASTTGQAFTGGDWLDVHFEAARPEYEAQLRAVGIRPGWRVLDAACGSGSFLPWLAELVGPTGSLAALDLAPDNVALVERRVGEWHLPCPVEVRAGTVLALPYPDASFDAVWFANTSQYLTDDELATALAELRRVVRPGGLVAVKDADPGFHRVAPAPPGLLARWFEGVARTGSVHAQGTVRAAALPGWLRRAGLENVWRRGTLIERTAPLDPPARQYWRDALAVLAAHAPTFDLPAAHQACWAGLRDPAALDAYLDDPDFYGCDSNILTVGTVPGAAG
ncbi:MAG: class I SAM-dependent methyltransferase [Thermomicrobiales bacterium]